MAPARETPPETEGTRKVRGIANPWLANRLASPIALDDLDTTAHMNAEVNVPYSTVEQVYWSEGKERKEGKGGCPLPIKATRAPDGTYDLSGGFMRRIGGNEQTVPRPLVYVSVQQLALVVSKTPTVIRGAIADGRIKAPRFGKKDGVFDIPVSEARRYIETVGFPDTEMTAALAMLDQLVAGIAS